MAEKETGYFKFRDEKSALYIIPVTTVEGSDSFNLTSEWSTVHTQGSTEAITAFNYVNNPTIPVQLKFHEDLWRDPTVVMKPNHTYSETIAKLASLQYPLESGSQILPPYLTIYINDAVYRGYFTNIRITQTGPLRNGYRIVCEFSGNFVVTKRLAPTRSDVASAFKTTYGG